MTESRRNLVLVRAGHQSLHRAWIAPQTVDRDASPFNTISRRLFEPRTRNWDLLVSGYESETYNKFDDEEYICVPGGKWSGIYDTISRRPEILQKYDYIWLPDDDIFATLPSINNLFDLMAKYKLKLAQPALAINSFYTYEHTLQCPYCRIRYTDMVELMVPCFRSDYLKIVMHLFRDTSTGWGIDWLWCRALHNNHFSCAIIDAVTVAHVRPLGGPLYSQAASMGETAEAQMIGIGKRFSKMSLDFDPTCYAAVGWKGFHIGGYITSLLMAVSLATVFAEYPSGMISKSMMILRCFRRLIKKHPELDHIEIGVDGASV